MLVLFTSLLFITNYIGSVTAEALKNWDGKESGKFVKICKSVQFGAFLTTGATENVQLIV